MRDRAGSGFNVFFVDPFSPEHHTLVRLLISQVGPVLSSFCVLPGT